MQELLLVSLLVPGKTKQSGRNSCSHQLCECDREFAMCLRSFSCPKSKAMCHQSKLRFLQNILMSFGSGSGMHDPTNYHSNQVQLQTKVALSVPRNTGNIL